MTVHQSKRDFISLGPSIRRLASEMGVKHTGSDALSALIVDIKEYLTNLDKKIIILLESNRVKTIKFEDVKYFVPDLIKTEYKPCRSKSKEYKHSGKKYKLTDCHFLTKAVIERHVRKDIGNQYRLSQEGLDSLIDALQLRLIKVISSAGLITRHAGRNTMNEGDVFVALHALSKC
jgi:histone H3/H4